MVLLLLPLVLGSTLVQDAATLDLKYRPVSKVVKLLKDMRAELNEEKAKDQAVFDKLTCWCETNLKEKTLATTVANKQIDGLVTDIERLSAKAAGLKATIAQVKKEVASNSAALDQATKVREKETSEFSEDEKDMMQSLQALKNAVFVLSKHHDATFMQMKPTAMVQVRVAAERVLLRSDSLKSLKPSQRRILKALVQQPQNAGSYTPQSGQIFGILSSMKEEFESNLSAEQKNEMQASSDFAELKAAKETEIDAGTTKIKSQSQSLADAEEKLADAKESLEGTRGALAADTEVLSSLKLQCQQTDKDFALRQKTRSEEIAAVSEAISILSDDDARDNFSKTLSLVQVHHERQRGVALLRKGARVNGPRSAALTQLANRAQLDVFVKIRKSIDDMITSLKKEQADEVKEKDSCVKEIRENEKAIALKQRAITELTAFMEEAEATLKTLSKEIVEHKAEVKETQKQMAAASEEREAENKEFQDAVKEQRAAQDVLKKAKARLEAFYKKKQQGLLQAQPQNLVQAVLGGHFVLYQGAQQPGAALSEKPKGFETYETKGKGASGVLALLSSIIKEAETMEKEALAAETDAQASYEEFIKGSNDSVSKLAALIASKTQEIAELTADHETAKADRSAALEDADRLMQTGVDLHKSCDFLVKNFDVRQAGRSQEMDALAEAKAVFSGADFA